MRWIWCIFFDMPAQIAHSLFGEDVLRAACAVPSSGSSARIKGFVEHILAEHGAAFRLGCQGPDLFYHNQRTRPVALEYGALLHRRAFGEFTGNLLRLCLPGPDPVAAYALGFSTHAFLDRVAHPFIVYKAGWVAPSQPETARYARCHVFFERVLDVLMLELLRSKAATSWDQDALLAAACLPLSKLVSTPIVQALQLTFPERTQDDDKLETRILNAFSDAHSYYRFTNPLRTAFSGGESDGYQYLLSKKGRASVALIYPEYFSLAPDYLNLAHSPWMHPCGEGFGDRDYGEEGKLQVERRSFPDLYKAALDQAKPFFCRLIAGFLDSGRVPDGIPVELGNGGLSATKSDGSPCAPTRADPLPLDAVLDAQYGLRLAWMARKTGLSARQV